MINIVEYTSYVRLLKDVIKYLESDLCKKLNGYIEEERPDYNNNYTSHVELVLTQCQIKRQLEMLYDFGNEFFNNKKNI